MYKLVTTTIFKSKLKIIYQVYFFVLIIIVTSLFTNSELDSLKIIYRDDYINEISVYLINIIKILTPLTTYFLLINHNQDYEKIVIPYLSRRRVYFTKVIVYTNLLTIFYILLNIYIAFINKLSGFVQIYSYNIIIKVISSYLGMLIMMATSLIFIVRKKELITILLLMISLIINIMDFQLPKVFLYLFPINVLDIINYQFTLIYQLVYLITLIIIGFIKYKYHNIN